MKRRVFVIGAILIFSIFLLVVWYLSRPSLEIQLQKAIALGDLIRVKALVTNGASLNGTPLPPTIPLIRKPFGEFPLHFAASLGHAEITAYLIQSGARLDLDGPFDGTTVLHRAVKRGHDDVVDLLLQKGIRLDVPDNRGNTPLHLAATLDYKQITVALLQAGADPNYAANQGEGGTPLHWARKAIIPLLIDAGSDVNAQDRNGMTPLHIAAKMGWVNEVTALLEHGADPNLSSREGHLPIEMLDPKLRGFGTTMGSESAYREITKLLNTAMNRRVPEISRNGPQLYDD